MLCSQRPDRERVLDGGLPRPCKGSKLLCSQRRPGNHSPDSAPLLVPARDPNCSVRRDFVIVRRRIPVVGHHQWIQIALYAETRAFSGLYRRSRTTINGSKLLCTQRLKLDEPASYHQTGTINGSKLLCTQRPKRAPKRRPKVSYHQWIQIALYAETGNVASQRRSKSAIPSMDPNCSVRRDQKSMLSRREHSNHQGI